MKSYTFCTASYHAMLKPGYFGQQIRNTLKVLKCGAVEGVR
jgi:hypothetical protein